ncbi:hypothetical protein Chor_015480 [Crotalus horridus]
MTAEERGAEEMSAAAATAAAEGLDITAKSDGGVLKVVKKEGTGTECPMIGDKVTVHYTGWLLDGTKFDSSRDRKDKQKASDDSTSLPELAETTFSQFLIKWSRRELCEVIKAWDIVVGTMKIGEVCQIVCKPEYAYGSAGSPPKIPANATLFFEVRLTCTLDQFEIEGRHGDRVFDQRALQFEVGEAENYDLPPGLDKTLQKMEKLEEAVVYLKPNYGFGSLGKPKFQIPPDADLQYEIKLKSFEKDGKYKQATLQYKKTVSWLEHETGLSDMEKTKSRDLRLAAHLNLAMCHLKLKEYSQVLENCNKALELDCNNEKGLFRRGEARLAINDFELARADFQKVLQLYPSNKAAKVQLTMCQQKIREQHEREKKMYANMFQRLADKETKLGADPGCKEEAELKEGKQNGVEEKTEVDIEI